MYEELKKLALDCRTERCADEDEQARNEREFLLRVDTEEILELIADRDQLFGITEQLKAESEALRKDAERYRFIRDADRSDGILSTDDLILYAMESLDGVIDEAMSREGEVRQ